jgi:hypothetical protein
MFIFTLGGCSEKEEVENVSIHHDEETVTEEKMYMSNFSINFEKIVVDEESGETKYEMFLDDDIVYNGTDVQLLTYFTIGMGSPDYEEIPLMAMLLLDGKYIPFSIDDNEETKIHYFETINGEEQTYTLKFKPYGVSKTERKEIQFIIIPFYSKKDTALQENDILEIKKGIISESEDLEIEESMTEISYEIIEDLKQKYNKDLHEISPYNGAIFDYIIQNEDGSVYYMGDYDNGSYSTYLFCDGELYNGFDNQYCMNWTKKQEGYVNKAIDTSGLSKGEHTLFAVTVSYNEDGTILNAMKAMNTNITITH